jgi:hypothetical protein
MGTLPLTERNATAAQIKAYCERIRALNEICAEAVAIHDDETARAHFAAIEFCKRQAWLLSLDLFDERPDLAILREEARGRLGPGNADSALMERVLYPAGRTPSEVGR